MQVAQVLFPALLAIVSSPEEYSTGVRRRALQIVHDMEVTLATMQGSMPDKQSSKAIATLLEAWVQPICVILGQPTTLHVCSFHVSALAACPRGALQLYLEPA